MSQITIQVTSAWIEKDDNLQITIYGADGTRRGVNKLAALIKKGNEKHLDTYINTWRKTIIIFRP